MALGSTGQASSHALQSVHEFGSRTTAMSLIRNTYSSHDSMQLPQAIQFSGMIIGGMDHTCHRSIKTICEKGSCLRSG